MKHQFMLIVGWLAVSVSQASSYIVTGTIEGEVCTNFLLFKTCGFHKIDAVKGEDGNLYPMNQSYSNVSEYNENSKRCWISLKATGGGMAGNIVNNITNALATHPELFENVKGNFEAVDPEYVTFPCIKR